MAYTLKDVNDDGELEAMEDYLHWYYQLRLCQGHT
jgi:hypothetical protein